MTSRLLPFCALLLAATVGCRESTGPIVCTAEARSSISVFVRDSVTGAFIASGATLRLQDGAFVDSASYPADEFAAFYDTLTLTTPNSFERAGIYTVTVRRAGYTDWQRSGVQVTRGICHVNSVLLTARMKPAA